MTLAAAAQACGTDEGTQSGDVLEREPGRQDGEGGAAGAESAPPQAGAGGSADGGGDAGAESRAGEGGGRECVPAPATTDALVRGLSLQQVSVLQAVSVPIMERMLEIPTRKAALVSGRPGLMRVFVSPEPGWHERTVRARLTLEREGEISSFELSAFVAAASNEAD
ncbi:MAG TPA: hypothetical protein VNG33_18700, partial [Polyangiaceae bacterium]|nr:hypothetical protein [Polyangiaceae bacterium]